MGLGGDPGPMIACLVRISAIGDDEPTKLAG